MPEAWRFAALECGRNDQSSRAEPPRDPLHCGLVRILEVVKSDHLGAEKLAEVNTYSSEQALVEDLIRYIPEAGSPWRSEQIATEFFYGGGWSDVLVLHEGQLVAIEAKLTKWRDALHQAYRNTSFAHRVFVCLPSDAAQRAMRYAGEFARRGVGLCTVLDGQIVIIHEARAHAPLQPWLAAAAVRAASES